MGIYKRTDTGRWEARLQIRGVKYRRSLPEAQNKQQALLAEAALRQEIYEGRYGREGQEVGSTDFVEFCKEVFLPSIKDRLKRWKNEEYKMRILCEYFRAKKLREITPMLIEGYRRKRLAEATKRGRLRHPSAVKAEIATLSSIFTLAIDNDLTGLNPCRKIKWQRGVTNCRRTRILLPEEETRLMPQLEQYPEPHHAVGLALNTGMRRMEILNLRLSNVRPKEETILVTGTKNGKDRVVPLNSVARAIIDELAARGLAEGGHLFHTRTGNNLSATEGAFHLARRRAKIDDLCFHDLRHTFATRLAASNVDPATIAAILGHGDLKMTSSYITPSLDSMRAAVEELGRDGARVLQFERKTG
ncbi:MAG: hypothetical protein QOF02_3676 [Blastocatellia bacterium]|jgi:integrase|nr:hypothetical protein [Blastocatellia bacterium]